MNGNETDAVRSAAAPPTTPGPLQRPEAARRWPKALGIVMLVFAGHGLLYGMVGANFHFVERFMMSVMPDPELDREFEVHQRWRLWIVSLSVLSIAVAGLLLTAGVGLLQRRRWAPRLSVIWAGIKIPLELADASLTCLIEQEAMELAPLVDQATDTRMVTSLRVIVLLLGLALPVFVLIWFSRRKIKREVSTWT